MMHTIHGPIGTVDVPYEDLYDDDECWADVQLVGETITLNDEMEMTYEEYFLASGQTYQELVDTICLEAFGYGE